MTCLTPLDWTLDLNTSCTCTVAWFSHALCQRLVWKSLASSGLLTVFCLCSSFLVCVQYPPGYLAAMANKTKKEACARPGRGGRTKHYPGRGRPRRQRKIKEKEENEEEEEEDMVPVASMEEEEPQSNGEQKTTRDSGGCFHSSVLRSDMVLWEEDRWGQPELSR